MKTFLEALQEAKDAQKEVENNARIAKDASHGDKMDKLDPSINEEADKQKDAENKAQKDKDASHGDQPDVLDESVIAGTIRCLVREASGGRVRAIATLTDDKNIDKMLKYAKLPPEAKDVLLKGGEFKHGDAHYLFDDIKEF